MSLLKGCETILAENSLTTLAWPGNSPDQNHIKNLWKTIKNKVADKQPLSTGVLNQALKEIWVKDIFHFFSFHFISFFCEKLICCMPQCIQAVIKSKIGHKELKLQVTILI